MYVYCLHLRSLTSISVFYHIVLCLVEPAVYIFRILYILHSLGHCLDLPAIGPLYWPPPTIVEIGLYDVDLRAMVDELYTRFHLILDSN